MIEIELPKLVELGLDSFTPQRKHIYFGGQDVWEAIEEEFKEPEDFASFSQANKKTAKKARVKNKKTLSLIQYSVDETIFQRIAQAITAKKAWDVLQNQMN